MIDPASTGDAAPAGGESLGRRVVVGARWIALLQAATMAATWITTAVLAHLLTPAEYGIAGMANIAVAIFTMLQDSGLRAALIHRRERIQAAADSATAYTPFLGLAMVGLCFAVAPLAARFFHHHEVTSLVRALGLVFFFRSISQVPSALLERELQFGRFTLVSVTGSIVQMATAILLALHGTGAWAVIGGRIAFEAWSALLLWPLSPIRPHPRRASIHELRQLLGYGRHLVGANVSLFVQSYIDVTVIGRFLGSASLGAYTLGYQTGKQAVATITYASNQVIFPAYAILQDDVARFRAAYFRSLRFICLFSVPAGVGLAIVSPEVVEVVYGARWSRAAPVLALISLMGVVLSVSATMGEVFKASGRTRLFFHLNLLQTAFVLATVLGAYRFGITAIAAAQAVSITLIAVLCARAVSRILETRRRDWMQAFGPPAVGTAIMAAAMLLTRLVLPDAVTSSTLATLALLTIEGVLAYLVALRLVTPEQFREGATELSRLVGLSRLRARGRSRRA